MNTHAACLAGFLAVAMVVAFGAGPAYAQGRVPRVEFGGNLGGFVAPGAGGFLPGTRVGVAITNRFAVESVFELNDWRRTSSSSRQSWLYSIQMKQMVRPGKQFGDGLFATYGGGGEIYHSHTNAQLRRWQTEASAAGFRPAFRYQSADTRGRIFA